MSPQAELIVRLSCFFGLLLALMVCEAVRPRRALRVQKLPRWGSNLALVAVNAASARLLIPVTAVGSALVAQSRGWGVLQLVDWPFWVECCLAILALDFAIYLQHVLFHAVPIFWRLHQVHHADLDLDVTTGLRFHTLEILLSALIKVATVLALGPPPVAVVIFEVLLNATSMFSHSNVNLPLRLDAVLRWIVVTPDMHRVHHSVIRRETNSNYGFNLPWWDFLLGTYRAQPQAPHETMTIGIAEIRDEAHADRLPWMLALPFYAPPEAAPITTRTQDTHAAGADKTAGDT